MTHAIMKKSEVAGLPIIKVNGRTSVYISRITAFEKVSTARWVGTAQGSEFRICGGVQAGGYRNEWYLEWDGIFSKSLKMKSMVECLRTIENC